MQYKPLITDDRHDILYFVGLKTPNDNLANLRHSQDMDSIGSPRTEFFTNTPVLYPKFGSRAESQRKAPDLWAYLCRPLSLRLSVRLCLTYIGLISMVYTFLIANKYNQQKLSELKKPRFISVVAASEQLARRSLAGLPLVFLSCVPAKECK